MNRPFWPAILVCATLLIAFLALIAWASTDRDVFTAFGEIMRDPWGLVTLADLYLGFAFVSVWIALVEQRKWTVPLWILALLSLGNLVTLVYLIIRLWKADSLRTALLPPAPAT